MCFSDTYLEKYRVHLSNAGLAQHPLGTTNKLRDTDDFYAKAGHSFSFNREIIYSYDVCGACEAHAILKMIKSDINNKLTVENAPVLKDMDRRYRIDDVNFVKCPS